METALWLFSASPDNMQITKKLIITNTLWSASAQVLVMGINLLVLPLFIKNLGAELYGIWVLSGVVLGYLNVFDFGFTQGLQKYAAEARVEGDQRQLSEVVVSGTCLLFFIGLLLGALFWFSADAVVGFFDIQPENQQVASSLLKISALFCVVMWPLRIVDVVLNASMRIKELSFLNAFKTGVQSLVMLGMVWVAADVVLIKWVSAGLIAACSSFGLVLVKKYVPEIRWNFINFQVRQLKRMHKFSLGMFYITVIGLLATQIDSLIIGKMLGMTAVAAYAVAFKLFQLIQRIAGMLMVAIMPTTFNLNASADYRRIQKLVDTTSRYRLLLTVPMAYIAILIAPDFIRLWVGESFVEHAIWAQVMCSANLFIGLGVANTVSRAMGHVKETNFIYSIQLVLNVCISIILVPYFGIGGPILGSVIAVILVGDFTMFPLFCRIMGIGWKPTYFMAMRILFVGFGLYGVGLLLRSFFDFSGLLELAIYSGLMASIFVLAFGLLFLKSESAQVFGYIRHRCEMLK